jgi:hypothetical protein
MSLYLCWQYNITRCGQHLVQCCKHIIEVLLEAIFILATSRSRKQEPRLDNEFKYIFQRAEALLNWLLLVSGTHPISTMLHTAQQPPENR